MNTFEVAQLFRRYCDEPDRSFLSDADVALYCKLGYSEFLNMVNEANGQTRVTAQNLTMNNTQIYDLTQASSTQTVLGTPSVLGPNPNVTTNGVNWTPIGRMTRLQEVNELDAAGNYVRQIQVVSDESKAQPNVGPMRVYWSGPALVFSQPVVNLIQIIYNFEQQIGLATGLPGVAVTAGQTDQTWVGQITAGTNTIIDDNLQAWHDMIPLFAYYQYAIMDAASNTQLMDRLAIRKAEIMNYLQQRSAGSIHYVNPTHDPSVWGTGY
jgi:hypothetical protein